MTTGHGRFIKTIQALILITLAMNTITWSFVPANSWPASQTLAAGKQVVQQFDSLGNTWVYLVYLPPQYDNQPSRLWPAIMFLGTQGSCSEFSPFERVYDDRTPYKYTNGGVSNYLRTPENCAFVSDSFIVIRPWYSTTLGSCGTGANYDAYFLPLFAHLKGKMRIDPARVHLTGYCLGGGTAYKLATQHPELIASASLWSVNGSTACIDLSKLPLLDNIGLRLYHGTGDNVIPLASGKEFRDSILARSTRRTAPFVWQEVAGPHETWHSYANCTDTVKALYDWMLGQKKTSSTAIIPMENQHKSNRSPAFSVSINSQIQAIDLHGRIIYKGERAAMRYIQPSAKVIGIAEGSALMMRIAQ